MTPQVAGYSQTLLRAMLDNQSALTPLQLSAAGKAARQLLAFAWDQADRNSWLVTNSLRSVCQSFGTDPAASTSLLRRAIEPDHLARYGYAEMVWITRELQRIATFDPGFVADIYAAVFGHEETSTDTTDMSGSRILSLTSNKKQDYDHAKWELSEHYPRFAEAAPVLAATAMLNVIESYRKKEDSTAKAPERFEFNGIEVGVIPDYSFIWDESFASHNDNEVKILDAFFRSLEAMSRDGSRADDLDQVIRVVTGGVRPAIIWRRLLQLGSQHKASVGVKLRALAWAAPLLWIPDTQNPAADFIVTIFELLRDDERRLVEEMIIALPNRVTANLRKAAERERAQLLIRLDQTKLVTPEAKALFGELQAANTSVEPTPRGPKFQVTSRAIDGEMYVREILGASVDTNAAKEFLDLHRAVKEFTTKQQNKQLSPEDIEAALPSLRALHSALTHATEEVDPKLLAMACGTLADACKWIANSKDLSCDTTAGQVAKAVLLELSRHPSPEHDPAHDASFDEHPCWGAPLARIEAAVGLMALGMHESCCGPDVLDAIDRLSRDPSPEVRYQIASNLTLLYKTAPEHMWRLLERFSQNDTSNGVIGAVAYTVNRLIGVDPTRTAELTKSLFELIHKGPGEEHARETCIHTFMQLYTWRDQETAKQVVYGFCDNVLAHRHEAGVMLFGLRALLSHGERENDSEADAVRKRAIKLFNTIVNSACDEVIRLFEKPADTVTDNDREAFQSVLKLIDSASHELYFASGVFGNNQADEEQPSALQQKRFYAELAGTIDRLSAVGYPSTVHHLIEMLAHFVSFDPKRVFLQIAKLVESGKQWGYQYESMAASEITQIVERYIAEYRTLLQEDAECRVALRKVLDDFIEAGWPAAQRLSYRLDEIFR
ncbi:MAG: hypothetical protein ACE14M_05425 [Terriglobales bacterium]